MARLRHSNAGKTQQAQNVFKRYKTIQKQDTKQTGKTPVLRWHLLSAQKMQQQEMAHSADEYLRIKQDSQ